MDRTTTTPPNACASGFWRGRAGLLAGAGPPGPALLAGPEASRGPGGPPYGTRSVIVTASFTRKLTRVSAGIAAGFPRVRNTAAVPAAPPTPAPIPAPLPPPAIAPIIAPIAAPAPTLAASFPYEGETCFKNTAVVIWTCCPSDVLSIVSSMPSREPPFARPPELEARLEPRM